MTLAQLLTLTWPSYWLWKTPNLAQLSTSIYIYIYRNPGQHRGESWPICPSRCRTEQFLRGILAKEVLPQTGPSGDQIPPLRGPDSPLWISLSKTPFSAAAFRAIKAHFQSTPPKSPKRPHPDSATIWGRFWGGDFFTFYIFFWGLYFLLPPFRHFGRWRLLKPLVF